MYTWESLVLCTPLLIFYLNVLQKQCLKNCYYLQEKVGAPSASGRQDAQCYASVQTVNAIGSRDARQDVDEAAVMRTLNTSTDQTTATYFSERKIQNMVIKINYTYRNYVLGVNEQPANLVLIVSRGCRMVVETTPPAIPATRCSYLIC